MAAEKNSTSEDSLKENLFGVSEELVQAISSALENNDAPKIQALIKDLHAADVSDLIISLNSESRKQFVSIIKDSLNPDVLANLDIPTRVQVLKMLGPNLIAEALKSLASDDALEVLSSLGKEHQAKVLQSLPSRERAMFEKFLSYPKDSAGRLMQRELVCVPPFWTVSETLNFIKNYHDLPEHFYTIYIIDPRHHPLGEISLSLLLRQQEETVVSDIMSQDMRSIQVTKDQEEVAFAFRHYGLVSAPVIDETGRIVGMITVDDVVDVIGEEVEEDILHIAKVHELHVNESVTNTAYWRIRWLIITLVNTLIASFVIAQFQVSIQKMTALSFLMTINAAMGGNSGMQVVTIVVRAIATRQLRESDIWRSVSREVFVSLITGTFFAFLLGSIAAFWVNDIWLGIILAVALFCNMLWAAFAGTMLPILIHRLGLDPAVSAGPILTTTTDVFGYAIFLGLATLILL
ncbi:MAG: magnesium transporter [Caedibacter sp. 37-49]|nr:MAG: magnesium transporter [Caedibacter sp. 37-49]